MRVVEKAGAALAAGLGVAIVFAACGRVAEDEVAADASTDAMASSDAGRADASSYPLDPTWSPSDAATPPDGGPPPTVACDGGTCTLPPSTCIDDHWLRYYAGGTCKDGLCEFRAYEMLCSPSQVPPDCYQGGCRMVIVR